MSDAPKSYPLPPSPSSFESWTELGPVKRQVDAEWLGNRGHPLNDTAHVQHEDWAKWYADAGRREFENADKRPPLEQAMAEGLRLQEETQRSRVEQAESLMDELEANGFARADVPDDIEDFELRGLGQQLLIGQGKFREVTHELEEDLRRLHAPQHLWRVFESLKTAPAGDKAFLAEVADGLIHWVHSENRRKLGLAPRRATTTE